MVDRGSLISDRDLFEFEELGPDLLLDLLLGKPTCSGRKEEEGGRGGAFNLFIIRNIL